MDDRPEMLSTLQSLPPLLANDELRAFPKELLPLFGGDFNGDKKADLFDRNSDGLGQGSISFLQDNILLLNSRTLGRKIADFDWHAQAIADLGNDNKPDIIFRNYNGSGQILAWNTDGNQVIKEELVGRPIPDSNWQIVGAGDFDNDGRDDLVLRNNLADQNLVWYMNGATIQSEALFGRGIGDSSWNVAAVGDFNRDGQQDIVLRHQNPLGLGQNIIWLMNGSTIIDEMAIGRDVPDTDWKILGAGDGDGDGNADLMLYNPAIGQNLLWVMNGLQIAEERPLALVFSN